MNNTLREKVLNFTFNNKPLIFNSPIVKAINLKLLEFLIETNNPIISDIMNLTSFIKQDISVAVRIKFIIKNIDSIPLCPVCHNECKIIDRNGLRHPLFNRTCTTNRSCHTKLASQAIGKLSNEVKRKHAKAQLNYKANERKFYIEQFNNTVNIINNYTPIDKNILIEFFQNKIKTKYKNSKFILLEDFKNNYDIICSLIKYTEFIKLELNESYPYDSFRFKERIYCLLNNKTEIPTCKFCGAPVKFINIEKGYIPSCPNCSSDKIRETVGYPTFTKLKTLIDTDKYEIIQFPKHLKKEQLIIRCKKCNNISKYWLKNGMAKHILAKPLCKFCKIGYSKCECDLFEYVQSIIKSPNSIIRNDRDVIAPNELDMYIPEKKIAIEFDGLYWHSFEHVGRIYHLLKTQICNNVGIKLIHIFEDEWYYKQDIVKSRLKHILNKTSYKIFARKCVIKEITPHMSNVFLEKYHIQGPDKASVRLGLFYKNRLVALMTFCKSRFNKNYEWELSRYVTVSNFNVIGGAGKLLKYFENNYNPKSLITYADRRWSGGELYKKLNFEHIRTTEPGYWYVKKDRRYNRVLFQKHKLSKLLENFDPNLSEWANMQNNGYQRIYDCGNLVFVKNYQ